MKLDSMKNILVGAILFVCFAILSGCASVPMASKEQDSASKSFAPPPVNKAGLYIFRNTFQGQALKLLVTVDGALVGQTANKTFFYKEISPESHTILSPADQALATNGTLTFQAKSGENYFVRQYFRMDQFFGGVGLELVSEEEGKKEVLQCERAQPMGQ